MKNWKKMLGVACAGALAASLALMAGCSASDAGDKKDGAAKSDSTEKVTYIIATDTTFAPFEYQEANGESVGIDMDIIKTIAEDQGFNVEIQALGFDAALQAVQSGQADGVIAGMSITEERKQKFDFSDSYFDSTIQMAVAQNSDVKSYEDLKGQNVAVKTGTQSAKFANSIKDTYGFNVVEFADGATMYQDVMTGNSAACFDDYAVIAYAVKTGSVNLKFVTEQEAGEFATPYGFGVAKGQNAELLSAFNEGLAKIKADGTYDQIIDKYTK